MKLSKRESREITICGVVAALVSVATLGLLIWLKPHLNSDILTTEVEATGQ